MVEDPPQGRDGRAGTIARLSDRGSRFFAARGIYLGRRSTKLHVALYRLTRGRLGAHVPGWPGARIALLDHTGARTGKARTTPVIYVADGATIAIAAAKAGQPTHPAWFHNLLANPETTIQVGSKRWPVRARLAEPDEQTRLWPRFDAVFPTYEYYRRQAAPREIPLVLLEPR